MQLSRVLQDIQISFGPTPQLHTEDALYFKGQQLAR